MSSVQTHRRDDVGQLNDHVSARSGNTHNFSSILSSTSNDGARTSSSTTSAANLAALVPPSMRTRTSVAALERRYSDSSESNSSSRRRKRTSALLPVAAKGSADSFELGTGYRSQSPPRHSPSNLSPPRERRRGSSLSDVSVSTAEDEVCHTPPNVPVTCINRTVSASDYAPLPEVAETPERAPPPPPKLARPRFGHEPGAHSPRSSRSDNVDETPEATTAHSSSAAATPPATAPPAAPASAAAAAVVAQSSSATTASSVPDMAAVRTASSSNNTAPQPSQHNSASTHHSTPSVGVEESEGREEEDAAASAAPLTTPPPSAASSAAASVASTPHLRHASLSGPPPRVDAVTEVEPVLPQPSKSSASSSAASSVTSVPPAQPPLPPPPLRHGAAPTSHEAPSMPPMTAAPPIAPRHLHSLSASDAEGRGSDTGFTPLPEIPREAPPKRADRHHAAPRTATPEQGPATNRTRSARRPTQSVQTARARAQQRRTAASTSPHSRGTPVSAQAEFFPGAKRLDDDRLPISTKLILGTACVVGVALVFYLGRSVYRYASVNIMEPSTPLPTSKFARARMPKKVVVSDKEAAKIARDIRDRIVGNMQSAIMTDAAPAATPAPPAQ